MYKQTLEPGNIYRMMPRDGACSFEVAVYLRDIRSAGPGLVEVLVAGEIKIVNKLDYHFGDINGCS